MSRWIITVIASAVVAIGAIVAAAIASGGDDSPEAAGAPDRETALEFRDCMEEHGADLPEPPSGGEAPEPGSEPPRDRFQGPAQMPALDQEALEACAELMPEAPPVLAPPTGGGAPPGMAPLPQN